MVATPKLYFVVERTKPYDHERTRVRVMEATGELLADLLDGCVDNKAGYGTLEAAEELGREYGALLQRGYTGLPDRWRRIHRAVTFDWLHASSGGYCEPDVEVGDKLADIVSNTKLARAIVAVVGRLLDRPYDALQDPADVIAALLDMGATECEYAEGHSRYRVREPVYPMQRPRAGNWHEVWGPRDGQGGLQTVTATQVRRVSERQHELVITTELGEARVYATYRTRKRAKIAAADLLRQQALAAEVARCNAEAAKVA